MRKVRLARMVRVPAGLCLLTGVVATAGFATMARAQERERLHVDTLDVGDRLYVVTGGGGNSLVLASDDGVLLIDTKNQGFEAQLRAVVSAVTDQPVTTIVNTHAHLDHTGGNLAFEGVTEVVAHVNTHDAMKSMEVFQGAGASGLPTRTFARQLDLLDDVDRMELRYFGPGHTDGDAVVVFPVKGIAFLGDLFPGKVAPVIDHGSGGRALAFPDTLGRVVGEIAGVTRVVSGHGQSERRPWWPWADFEQYVGFAEELLATVSASFRAGQPIGEAVDMADLAGRYPEYDLAGVSAFAEAVYEELGQ